MLSSEEKVEVLMVSMAFQGHMNPMINFAKLLTSKGLHVTIATTEVARHRIHSNPNSHDSQIHLEFFSDGLSLDFDRVKFSGDFCDSLHTQGSKNFSTLLTSLPRSYSCMIINPFMPWAIDIAQEHGIPCAILWIQSSAVFSIFYRYYKNVNFFPNLDDPNRVVQLPGLPTLEVRDLPSFMLPSGPSPVKNMLSDLFHSIDKVKWVFTTSFDDIEEEIVKSMDSLTPIRSIGPLVSPFLLGQKETGDLNMDMWKAEESCMGWLDDKPKSSVIYVSFGSVVVLTQKQIDNIAMALKNSGKSFLWVVKPPEKGCNEEDNDDIGELPFEFLEETKGRGLVVTWCPQEKVLMHPSMGCFVTHCGWNSALETVVAGVPVIAYPKWSDQPTNAKLFTSVFENGVRVNCGDDGVASMEEVERCVRILMEEPEGVEMKKKALKMKEAARKALEDGGSSDRNINQFISELIVGNKARA